MTATHVRTQYYLLELIELIPSVELVLNVNQITHRIELELELMPKNHQNPSPDSDPAVELIQPYCVLYAAANSMIHFMTSAYCFEPSSQQRGEVAMESTVIYFIMRSKFA